jgi:hypothetical protein
LPNKYQQANGSKQIACAQPLMDSAPDTDATIQGDGTTGMHGVCAASHEFDVRAVPCA